MQSISYRIWTRVAVSILYDDNYYATGSSQNSFIQFSIVFVKCMIFVWYLVHYQTLNYPSLGNNIIVQHVFNPMHGNIFPSGFRFSKDVLVYIKQIIFFFLPIGILFAL